MFGGKVRSKKSKRKMNPFTTRSRVPIPKRKSVKVKRNVKKNKIKLSPRLSQSTESSGSSASAVVSDNISQNKSRTEKCTVIQQAHMYITDDMDNEDDLQDIPECFGVWRRQWKRQQIESLNDIDAVEPISAKHKEMDSLPNYNNTIVAVADKEALSVFSWTSTLTSIPNQESHDSYESILTPTSSLSSADSSGDLYQDISDKLQLLKLAL